MLYKRQAHETIYIAENNKCCQVRQLAVALEIKDTYFQGGFNT